MVRVKENLRLPFAYVVPKLAQRNTVPLTVRRTGKTMSIDVPVVIPGEKSLLPYLKGDDPSYFVWGPLCFSHATGEVVEMIGPYLAEQWAARRSRAARGGDRPRRIDHSVGGREAVSLGVSVRAQDGAGRRGTL